MSKLQVIADGLILGAASIMTNIATGTRNVIDTISSGDVLPQISQVAETSNIPTPDTINTVANLITQLVILATTLWRIFKKDKPKDNSNK